MDKLLSLAMEDPLDPFCESANLADALEMPGKLALEVNDNKMAETFDENFFDDLLFDDSPSAPLGECDAFAQETIAADEESTQATLKTNGASSIETKLAKEVEDSTRKTLGEEFGESNENETVAVDEVEALAEDLADLSFDETMDFSFECPEDNDDNDDFFALAQ